jgi:aarF domain-containing kinase
MLIGKSYRVTLNENDKSPDDEEVNTQRLKACHQRCADRTLKVLEKNGSIFIKLGQHLSSMNYLLPEEYCKTMLVLQDRCPVSSYESIEAMFFKDTGEHLSDYFSEFAREPVGAASLAQVHVATIKETGQKVAVKMQHPHLGEWATLDLKLTSFTFSTLKRFFPEYDLEWLSSEMESSLPQELDFKREGRNAMRAKEYFSHIPSLPLVIPDVLWAKDRILVMDYVSGHRPDDLQYIDSHGISRDEVSAALARIFNEMIFGTDAPLHCDPHGGNIAVRTNPARRHGFDIILYDHGLYRDIPQELRRSYAKLWLAILDADEAGMRRWSYEVAGVTDEHFRLFASAITGRDYKVLENSVAAPKTATEKKEIGDALAEGMLQQLVQLLGKVPPIILLILKTNDLTRSLDEGLQTKQGPIRTFMILARYCARTVWQEQVEKIRESGSLLRPTNMIRLVGAWLGYFRVGLKLEAFERWLSIKALLGYA